jgi:hypothetical protein
LVFFLECDFYWINWTRADFAPQIKIDKYKKLENNEDYIRFDQRPGSSVGIVTDYGLDGPGIE